jgi:hypothetical protein
MCECNIDEVKANALAQGIALSEIAIIYRDLTASEKVIMRENDLITHESEDSVIGRFSQDGEALFKDKVRGVLHIGA